MSRRPNDCPDWLDDDARDEWRRLQGSGATIGQDPDTVAAYCFTLSLWKRVRSVVDCLAEGGSSDWMPPDGSQRPHPARFAEAVLAAELLELSTALGLEPIGREALKPSRVLVLDEGP